MLFQTTYDPGRSCEYSSVISIPYTMHLRGWSNVIGSGAVAIGGGIAVKQMDNNATGAIILSDLGVTRLKPVK